MAFIDEMRVQVKAGRGGDGVTRWLHVFGTDKGGPSGGDGGKGGDVIFEGVRDLAILSSYRFTKKFEGEKGGNGDNKNMHGADGKDFVVKVPVGSVITKLSTQEVYEILEDGERVVLVKGGAGGFGNAHFKSSVNQNPFTTTQGKKGEESGVVLTLKLIADVGIIGVPNAGKSSLINEITKAQSKVGAYPFTTLDPHLGEMYGYILADVPGIIEGASSGKGLGTKFLRHIERTRELVHLVSVEHDDVGQAYRTIRTELASYGRGLETKDEIVVLSKIDLVDEETRDAKLAELASASGKTPYMLSVIDDESIKAFSDMLVKTLRERP